MKANYEFPKEWKKYIYKTDGTKKKIIVYNTSVCSLYEYKEKTIKKIRSVIDTFQDNIDDVALIWRSDPLIDIMIPSTDAILYKEYIKIVEDYITGEKGIYYNDNNPEILISFADAYYGDVDKMIQEFRNRRLPIMIQNVEI